MEDLTFEIWCTVWNQLRSHPVLWVPYFIAEGLAILVWRVRGIAQAAIIRSVTTHYSVLGGESHAGSYFDALAKASIVYLPVGLAAVLISVFLLVMAMPVTSALVHAIIREQRPDFCAALRQARPKWPRALALTVLILLLFAIPASLLAFLWVKAAGRSIPGGDIYQWLVFGGSTIAAGLVCWILTPFALKLLGRASDSLPPRTRGWGMLIGMFTVALGHALGILAQRVENQMATATPPEDAVFSVINSLAANVPFVFLFVAFGMMALHETEEDATAGLPDPEST